MIQYRLANLLYSLRLSSTLVYSFTTLFQEDSGAAGFSDLRTDLLPSPKRADSRAQFFFAKSNGRANQTDSEVGFGFVRFQHTRPANKMLKSR